MQKLLILLLLLSANAMSGTCYISHKCGIPLVNMVWGPVPGEYGEVIDVETNQDCIDRAFNYLEEEQANKKCVLVKGNATANYEDDQFKLKTKINFK